MSWFLVPAMDADLNGYALGQAANLSTLLTGGTATGDWNVRYWVSNETIGDGDYVEFIISQLGYNCAWGVGTSGDAPAGLADYGFVCWPFNQHMFAICTAGGLTAFVDITWQIGDRFRIRVSGTDIIVSQNGTDIYTYSAYGVGPFYVRAGCHIDGGSVCVDNINGTQPVTTKLVAAMTPEDGVPTYDVFANDARFYYSTYNWLDVPGIARCRETNMPDAYYKIDFTGPNCAILLDTYQLGTSIGGTYIHYRVDGGPWSVYYPTNFTRCQLQIASGLHVGPHSAEVTIRGSDYGTRCALGTNPRYASIFFYGVRVPLGSVVTASDVFADEILIYGDSNTEGGDIGPGAEDAQQAWGRVLANLLGVEHSVQSFPGLGWEITPAPGGIPVFGDGWNLRNDGSPHDFDTKPPKYVFISMGQNDSQDLDALNAVETLNEMLAGFPVEVTIFVCVPCGRHNRTDLINNVATVDSPRVVLLDNPDNILLTNAIGGPGFPHMDPEGQIMYANNIYASLLAVLGDYYLRPGGVDTYLRPGGVDTYIRP